MFLPTNNYKGVMDTLLYFLSDLPNGLSSLLHQDFASALFSTAPSATSTGFSHQHQHHGISSFSWFFNYKHQESNSVHGPQRIPPHPLLEMAASNILIRLGLLVVLCLGAFYYCVTTIEQQQRQIAGAVGGAGSNWLADPIPAATATAAIATNSTSTTAPMTGSVTNTAESHPQRSLSNPYPSVTGILSTTGSSMLLGSTTVVGTGNGTNTFLAPGITAAEVMASLGRSVNSLEQLHHQQLQQQRIGGLFLNPPFASGGYSSHESPDSTTATPSSPVSITATIISALIRSTATAMALTCGTDHHQHSHLSPYSASTTPAMPCLCVFSGFEKVADHKSRFEPGWKESAKKDGDAEPKFLEEKDIQQDTSQPAFKNKQKDLDSNSNDDDQSVYQSEQEFGCFPATGPFNPEDDTWREYRNMMYYSSNYPSPYSATFGSGGGESSRSNSRRSSIFAPSPSPPAPVSDAIAPATTIVVSHAKATQGLAGIGEEEERESPFWAHFYTLDATFPIRSLTPAATEQSVFSFIISSKTISRQQGTSTNRDDKESYTEQIAFDIFTLFALALSFYFLPLFFRIGINVHNSLFRCQS
ncbi:hypothetical protein BGZ47_011165 [Haplosporangium gracile]|nr:hypothetical protein BGZ47_011165 [Haplosporangium gracile]